MKQLESQKEQNDEKETVIEWEKETRTEHAKTNLLCFSRLRHKTPTVAVDEEVLRLWQ